MQFYEITTAYHMAKRALKDARLSMDDGPEVAWYDYLIHHGTDRHGFGIRANGGPDRTGNTLVALHGERTYFASGKPYYKVFPRMAEMMAEISIDIPCEEVRMPYRSFGILLANDPTNELRDPGGPRMKWLMVTEVLVAFETAHNFKIPMNPEPDFDSGDCRGLFINYAFEDDATKNFLPRQYNYMLGLNTGAGTLEDFFAMTYEHSSPSLECEPGEYVPSRELTLKAVKVAVATAFFGVDCHEVVMPDLPRRKVEQRANQRGRGEKDALDDLKKQHRDGKHWTIGREITLPLPQRVEPAVTGEDRKKWSHAVLRRGHMRWQAHGTGRAERKLLFIHPHMCRPDLPLATAHGYRIPDQKENT